MSNRPCDANDGPRPADQAREEGLRYHVASQLPADMQDLWAPPA